MAHPGEKGQTGSSMSDGETIELALAPHVVGPDVGTAPALPSPI